MTEKTMKCLVLAFAALISMTAISAAQPGFPDDRSWLNPPWGSYNWPDNWPNQWEEPYPYPTPEPISGPSTPSGMYSDSAPTNDRPGGYEPATTPSASTGSPISYLSDGASLSEREVSSLPGGSSLLAPGGSAAPLASGGTDAFQSYYGGTQAYRRYYGGLQQWIYYCGRWTYGPAALYYGQRTNTIIRTDQYQRIWSFERYPNGHEYWQYWGYWYPGYHHAWFGADARGWHQIAVWGSSSGWSNPIWVYVW